MIINDENEKESLIKSIKSYLESNPSDADDFLNVIATALKNYKKAVSDLRDQDSVSALALLLISRDKGFKKLPPHQKVAYIIDAAFILFPKGITAHSSCEKEFFDEFKQVIYSCDKNNLMEWLKRVKKDEYIDWLRKLNLLDRPVEMSK